MVKYFIVIGIVIGLVCFYLLYDKGKKFANPVAGQYTSSSVTTAGSTIAASGGSPSNQSKNAAYDIYSESFQAWNGIDKSLKTTESGWYQVGEMSSRGYVTAVSDRRARIAQPDGRTAWVVAAIDKPNNAQSTPSPSVSPTPSPVAGVIVAPDSSTNKATPLATTLSPTPSPVIPLYPAYHNGVPISQRPVSP